MKILVISQYYYPEPFKIHEICEELVKRGHEVTVVTGRPNYPDGNLYSEYVNNPKMKENVNGVNVIRTKIILRGHNPISLVLNYFSYPKKAKKVVKSLNDNFDIVYVYQLSPVFMIKPALYYKKKYNKKVLVYCLDLWPESLKVLHINDSNPIFKLLKTSCKKIYKKCNYIMVTSPYFAKYINTVNKVNKDLIEFLPQHGEKQYLEVDEYKKQKLLNMTFAGNIGKAQDFDCLVNAIKEIPKKYYNQFKITIIGSGSYENELKRLIHDNRLESLFVFKGRKKPSELKAYYDSSSLFLLSLEKDSAIGKTIPGKLQTYLSSGRGIIGSIDGTASEIIKESKAGEVCAAGDYKSLAKIIIKMIEADDNDLKEYSLNARNYFLNHFTIEKHVDRLLLRMEKMLDESI